jgi:hypothetical protein
VATLASPGIVKEANEHEARWWGRYYAAKKGENATSNEDVERASNEIAAARAKKGLIFVRELMVLRVPPHWEQRGLDLEAIMLWLLGWCEWGSDVKSRIGVLGLVMALIVLLVALVIGIWTWDDGTYTYHWYQLYYVPRVLQ